jgi:hypothetical protein
MTGPDDSQETRPISVAELLARNGTIGAPPVGGRRRRRRGDTDSVTVAELTGEIPTVHDDTHTEPVLTPTNGTAPGRVEPAARDDYDEHVEYFDAPGYDEPGGGAEQMRPDPLDDDPLTPVAGVDVDDRPMMAAEPDEPDDSDDLPSYLRSRQGTLFGGGQTMADDLARGGRSREATPDEPATAEVRAVGEPPTTMSTLLRGGLIVLQSIVAVAFGAGLFIAFDELWKWNNVVALVLSVLVILGLVVAVRLVRKTEDIASTLIAVAVGALVTLGPLALLQSN